MITGRAPSRDLERTSHTPCSRISCSAHHPKPAAKVLARPRADKLARAAAALALSYDTWRTLTRDEGLTDAQAAQVAVGLAAEET